MHVDITNLHGDKLYDDGFVFRLYRNMFLTIDIRDKGLGNSWIFTARCYAERGYATVSRLSVCLSVCLSVTLRYDIHTGTEVRILRKQFHGRIA